VESRVEAGIYVRPCDGETLSGDVVFVQPQGDGVFAAVIDALGHGPDAHQLGVQLTAAPGGPQQRWRGSITGHSKDGQQE
jgi:hypothetical protein